MISWFTNVLQHSGWKTLLRSLSIPPQKHQPRRVVWDPQLQHHHNGEFLTLHGSCQVCISFTLLNFHHLTFLSPLTSVSCQVWRAAGGDAGGLGPQLCGQLWSQDGHQQSGNRTNCCLLTFPGRSSTCSCSDVFMCRPAMNWVRPGWSRVSVRTPCRDTSSSSSLERRRVSL